VSKKAAPNNKPGAFRRFLRNLFLLALLAAAGAAWYLHGDYRRFAARELALGDAELVLEVKRGDSFDHVLRRLRRLGVREGHDLYWKVLAWEQGVITRLQVGEYALGHGLSPGELLFKLERGDVIQHRFTIVEGWTFRELRLALARDTGLEQTLTGLSDAEVMQRIGAPGEHPEGRFLPETYNYTKGISDADLLKRTYTAMKHALEAAWAERDRDLPLKTPYEALILASIVEKETGVAAERPQIAGVFVRRLKLGMKLQTDPTVIYGLGTAFDGNLTRKHLEDDTQYNTYARFGLPPTPIALPGRAALQAAVKPAPGDALYFVSRGDGSHEFTSNLADHNRAVARWQLGRR
jgi:UPF0755 protein